MAQKEGVKMDSKLCARKILESGDLDKEGYSLKELFQIRDALNILQNYGLADEDLLLQVNKYILQKINKENP